MAAVQLDDDTSDLKAQVVEKYPKAYSEYKAHIAGLKNSSFVVGFSSRGNSCIN